MINWKILNNQFCFSLNSSDNSKNSAWLKEENSPYYDPLKTLHVNGLAEFKDNCFYVHPYEVYKLDSIDSQILDLPEPYPYTLLIEADGIINRPGFLFKLSFYDFVPNGSLLKVTRTANILKYKDNNLSYLLSESQLKLCEHIDLVNKNSISSFDKYKMFQYTATIKNLANEAGAHLDSYLNNENIILPDAIELDLKYENNTLKVIPSLPKEEVSKEFTEAFNKGFSARSSYSFSDQEGKRGRIVFSDEQTAQLKQIKKDFTQVKDKKRIQKIIEQPEQFFDTDILDISCFYSDRVIDYGIYKPKCYPFISPYKSQWITGVEVENRAQGTTRITFQTEEDLTVFEHHIELAEQKNQSFIQYQDSTLALEDAKKVVALSREQLQNPKTPAELKQQKDKKVLIIQENADELEYINQLQSKDINKAIPLLKVKNLRNGITLKEHQQEGVAWLQYLYQNDYKGCLLADDMGLGKTLQILYFINWYFSTTSSQYKKPCLIVAPISLLENWDQEYHKFFDADYYQIHVSTFLSKDIAKSLSVKDIEKMRNSDIVLTNYETIRSCQLNFCAVDFSIIATDEAQKIKTPGTMVTNALKALKGDFRIALTGTPVENTFLDLWCIIDFAVPGLLGNAKQFAKRYQTPLKDPKTNVVELGNSIRAELGDYIKRRLKSSINLDLPQKHIHRLPTLMPQKQHERYAQEINQVIQKRNSNSNAQGSILQSILRLKMISDHPYLLEFDVNQFDPEELVNSSAKLLQTITILKKIKMSDEKVIIYSEFKDVQKMLRRIIKSYFGFTPYIINGDTPASQTNAKKSILTRQASINYFESVPGFNVIIMSPIAAGMGLNVVGANHVIHYSRHWNPAKEEQATDRVYRIGQTRDVHIYYPMAISQQFDTFDVLLDKLLFQKKELATATLFPSEQTEISKEELFHNLYAHPTSSASNEIQLQDISKLDHQALSKLIFALFFKQGKQTQFNTKDKTPNIDFVLESNSELFIVKCATKANRKHLLDLNQTLNTINNKSNKTYKAIFIYLSSDATFEDHKESQANITLYDKEDILSWLNATPVKWSELQSA